ncbi:ABC transporter substrate-binding protein [Rhizobium leucaenae]|uniref:ABC-type nitrate/sulfonate/bicarbonate transport system substrate-binding protein n=1 Tax=Rhizobium leucaenae TaxID=29450 RepID=A0A7W6ZV22_9HYPH|nr:ABC-type nitrate/sulfonate/bicarbonate transport system substrate-binding protein [Rhizobium leucaenae]MBB6302740.1 ABC-type nitrate/sulfonate/bicarbonate transport system substrate-binding protein [Rhizobium leucaenae]
MQISRRSFAIAAVAAGMLLTAPASATFAAETDQVTIRYLSSQGGLSAHELADALGYFKDTGVTVKDVGYAPGGPASLFALASGNVEVGGAATAAVLNSIAGGNDFVAAYPSNGIDKTTESIFYSLDGSPIKSIKDLAGKTIAVNTLGAHLDYTVREALHSVGLPENSAKLVVVPGPQLEQVLRSKQVDVSAFGYWQKTYEGVALKSGGLQKIFGDTDVLGEIAGGFTVLRRDWIKQHPQAAKIFIEKSQVALEYARVHPEETKAVIAKVLASRGENADIAQYFTGYGVREGGKAVPRDLQFWIDILARGGVLKPGQLKAEDILYDPANFAVAGN